MKLFHYSRTFRLGIFALLTAFGFQLRAQCPDVTIREKYEHLGNARPLLWRLNQWDTVVNCKANRLTLHADHTTTTQHFNGTYLVESIPYNPVDTTFHAGQRLNISTDDAWENSVISFPFDFVFFGYTYDQAVVGSNGIVSFNSGSVKAGTTSPTGLTNVTGQHCAYQYSDTPIPTTNFVGSPDNSYNAIYGVYEDIDPAYLQSSDGTCGMFRSIGGTYPCRYLCASVNGVDLFGNHNNYNSYQIVCYEGTNIIEVHVKHRHCCSSTNGGKGIIGIQNTTGSDQESHYHDPNYITNPSYHILPNSPGAFTAPGRNGWTGETQYEAWRFTPQGETAKNISWWRLFEDANGNIIDSVEFTNDPADTNGYYIDVNEHTTVSVAPTRPTRYLVKCRYQGANAYWYGMDGESMRDTITVGVDFANDMHLEAALGDTVICEGRTATVNLIYPTTDQTIDSCTWSAIKVFNGTRTVMPPAALQDTLLSCVLHSQDSLLTPNHIDSVWIYCTATFKNGCTSSDSILIRTYPNTNIHDTASICDGESYLWCGETYTTHGTYNKHYYSQSGCDSNHYLHLIPADSCHCYDTVCDTITENQLPWNALDSLLTYDLDTTIFIPGPGHPVCDTLREYHLKVWWNIHDTITYYNCEGGAPTEFDSILIYGDTIMVLSYQGIHGEDSTIYFTLNIVPGTDTTIYDTILEDQLPWFFFDSLFTDSVADCLFTTINANGCDSTIHYNLHVYWNGDHCDTTLSFGNVVTPNGDGVNDRFVIGGLLSNNCYKWNELTIFDRNGHVVYRHKNISRDDEWWDPGADRIPSGTYFYIFKAHGVTIRTQHQGVIEVLREK